MSANSYNEALRKYIDDHPFDGDDSGCETSWISFTKLTPNPRIRSAGDW